MPTNGKAALAAIMLEQNTPEEFNLYGTDQVAAAAPPEMTDQLLFQRLRGRAGTRTMIWTEMMRNPVFRLGFNVQPSGLNSSEPLEDL